MMKMLMNGLMVRQSAQRKRASQMLAMVLVLVTLCSSLAMASTEVAAGEDARGIYQAVDKTPVREGMYETEKKIGTLYEGEYVSVVSSKRNKWFNKWYVTASGGYIFHKHLKKVSTSLPESGSYITSKDSPVYYVPASRSGKVHTLPEGTVVEIKSTLYSDSGNLFGELFAEFNNSRYRVYAYMGNLKKLDDKKTTVVTNSGLRYKVGDKVYFDGWYFVRADGTGGSGGGAKRRGIYTVMIVSAGSRYPYAIAPQGKTGVYGWTSLDYLSKVDHETVAEAFDDVEATPIIPDNYWEYVVFEGNLELIQDALDAISDGAKDTYDIISKRNILQDNIDLLNLIWEEGKKDGFFDMNRIVECYSPLIEEIAKVDDRISDRIESALESNDPKLLYQAFFTSELELLAYAEATTDIVGGADDILKTLRNTLDSDSFADDIAGSLKRRMIQSIDDIRAGRASVGDGYVKLLKELDPRDQLTKDVLKDIQKLVRDDKFSQGDLKKLAGAFDYIDNIDPRAANLLKGDIGEALSYNYQKSILKGYDSYDQLKISGNQGFDSVHISYDSAGNVADIRIVEAKFNSSQLSTVTSMGDNVRQMDDIWVKNRAHEMIYSKTATGDTIQVGLLIQQNAGKVTKILDRVGLDGNVTSTVLD